MASANTITSGRVVIEPPSMLDRVSRSSTSLERLWD